MKYKKKNKSQPARQLVDSPSVNEPAVAKQSSLTPLQLMEQRRAGFALQQVQAAIGDGQCKDVEFRSYARSLPAMIQNNGLGQAVAFYLSKGSKNVAYKRLYDVLSDWLTSSGQPYADSPDLLDGITQQDMYQYRHAQAEAQALLSWVKKFAEALCESEPED
ncbi:MAG: type III-B CRISPR module-associated protein Cmr5 [Motiliproteus sp.]